MMRFQGKKEIFLHEHALEKLCSYILYFRSSAYKKLKGYKKYGQIGDNTYFYKEHDKQQTKK